MLIKFSAIWAYISNSSVAVSKSSWIRTQSGFIIPNLSKQPTPAPSPPDRDLFDNEGASNFEMDIDTFSCPSHGGSELSDLNSAGTGPLSGRAENQLITSLKLEIKNLQQQLLNAGNAVPRNASRWSRLLLSATRLLSPYEVKTRACKAIYGIVETGFERSRVIGRGAKGGAGCGSGGLKRGVGPWSS